MISVSSAGYQYTHRDGLVINRPIGVPFYVLVLFKSPARILMNDVEIIPPLNSSILFDMNTTQYYESTQSPYTNDWVHFTGDDVAAFASRLKLPFNQLILLSNVQMVSRLIQDIQNELRVGGIHHLELIDIFMQGILIKLSEYASDTNSAKFPNPYRDSLTEIRNNLYSEPWKRPTVQELSEKTMLSKSHFQHLYHNLFGVSIMSDMIQSRLEQACYLLKNSNSSVSLIAEVCGYSNDVHFMRQFKKKLGISPGVYRSR